MGILELIEQRTLEEAQRVGEEQGISKGISKQIRKSIQNMLAKNFDLEMIAEILEISVAEVEMIK